MENGSKPKDEQQSETRSETSMGSRVMIHPAFSLTMAGVVRSLPKLGTLEFGCLPKIQVTRRRRRIYYGRSGLKLYGNTVLVALQR